MLQNADDITVLIPAAGPVEEGILALSNITCSAMIPVAGRPVIHWTLSYLQSLGIKRFVIAIPRKDLFVEDFVEYIFGQEAEIEFIVPSHDGGLGWTIRELSQHSKTSSSLVVLGDTHFQFADSTVLGEEIPLVLTSEVEESYRWCTVDSDAEGVVESLHDKVVDLQAEKHSALIGVYYFPDNDLLKTTSASATEEARKRSERASMADILDRYRIDSPVKAVEAKEWLDCGNADRQAEAHRSLLQKREFNELSIDSVMGTITKRSRNVAKFIDEINFLRLLPNQLQVLFPRVLDYSIDWNEPHITLEYYGYPSLAEAFVFENIDAGIWERVFSHIHNIVTTGFHAYSRPVPEKNLREMYLEKTFNRLQDIDSNLQLRKLVETDERLSVNGQTMPSLSEIQNRLEDEFAKLASTAVGSIMHGDLCFSNILYDMRSRVCKFVDPRGSFGDIGIYGDSRYDVAKLFHSVFGLYDFITNDLFRVAVKDDCAIELEICSRPHHEQVCARFEEIFFPSFDRRQILLITGLLFASMPALHYDKPQRQLAMYARALQIFAEAFSLPTTEN
ncbi:MAG: sugar phosphate nucleotidyltransferase [Planctomycetota bacterium]